MHNNSIVRFISMRLSYIIIVNLLFLFPITIWAQYEDEDDKDAILNNPYRMGAARKAQLESAWSLSDPNFNFREVSSKGGWHTQKVNTYVQPVIITPQIHSPKKTHARRKSSKQSASAKRTQGRSNSDFMEWRREQIMKAQDLAAKRKKEEEAERRINMAKQASRYNAQMSGYRMRNDLRAAKGVDKINSIQATDFANIPQGKPAPQLNTLKGKEMAEMLKNKEQKGQVNIVWIETNEERQNRNNVIIDNDNNLLDLYDDGGYNKNELDCWRDALMSQSPTIQLNELHEETQWQRTLLIDNQWLDIDSLNITTLPNMGCVALIGDSILLLDNDSLPFLKWNVKNNATQIVTCGDRVFGKHGNKIVEIK